VLDMLGVAGVAFIPMLRGKPGLGRTYLQPLAHRWWYISWGTVFLGFVFQLVGQLRA
jgi:hypothetical protein